ncbi:histone deacetylase 4 isoform X1 [Musca domestica]|uniref:Histone deacetylase n=1 Tax=Musca domestica TaxID=7370 RepID=A0A1I8M818_MUSDO|nr:histone deacetylase 4 isoform X1 [Musca domestica]XP_011291562.1 histone deacetylase 4 isoform X1 [Musca domestica]
MTSPEERISTHDLSRDSGTNERLHITPGTLDFSRVQPATVASDLDQQILELKQKQELQKQMLFHTFQEKSKQLELQHKLQLEHKFHFAVHSHGAFQELQEQRIVTAAVEEQQQRERREREQREREAAAMVKRKENSANASPEVKQILNCFILNRKQAASSPNGMQTTSPYRNRSVVKSSSGESLPAGAVTSSHPYKIPQPPLLKYETDFPLRKTASEPNLLKMRLKQSVIERKARVSGPAGLRRHERLLQAQRRQQKQNSTITNCNSTPDSGPNSPPSSCMSSASAGSIVGHSRGSPTNAPIQEENEDGSHHYHSGQRSSINDLSLFSSPSMPNISLGRPHLPNAHSSAAVNCAMFAALRQQHAAGIPPVSGGGSGGGTPSAAGGHHPTPPTYYNPLDVAAFARQTNAMIPPGTNSVAPASVVAAAAPPQSPVVRSASATSTSSSQASLIGDVAPPLAHAASTGCATALMHVASTGGIHAVVAAHHSPSSSSSSGTLYGQPITDAQVAQAHLNKQGHRPLGRTQSAPLPLGHPMLTGSSQINIAQTHYENSDAERQAYEQHLLLTQKIRQTVLTRSGAVRDTQQLLKEEEDAAEVMDLTDKKKPPKTVLTSTVVTSTSQNLPNATVAPAYAGPPPACIPNKPNKLMRNKEYLEQQRQLLYMQNLQMDDAIAQGLIRPLSRTLSSPLVHLGPHGASQIPDTGQATHVPHAGPIVTSSSADHIPPVNLSLNSLHGRNLIDLSHRYGSATVTSTPHEVNQNNLPPGGGGPHKVTTGLAYDNLMLKHACICGNNSIHPEHSGRLQSVWARLNETDLAKRCHRLRSPKATLEEIQTVHTEAHSLLFGSNQCQLANRQKLETAAPSASFVRLSCGGVGVDLDTTWNEHHTAVAARMAAGCVIDLAMKTAKGDLKNGFAVVRPPGHHAEANLAMGFCFFNSIAIAAKIVRQRVPEIKKILVVDWDVHHGNGTQQALYSNPDILYLSIHRHDDGNFFPGTGGPTECGTGPGLGYNVNISWSGALNPPLGDAEYIAAFRTIVMPIARYFNPDLVLVSAGFDAAAGHPAPLGGYLVSPACFGYMTRELMQLAKGKVVLALEGGYDLPAICDSAQECVRALLGDPLSPIAESELNRQPCQNAIDTLQKTIAIQLQHWPCVRRYAHTVGMSALEALKIEHDASDTVTAMASLSMQTLNKTRSCDDSEEPMDQDESK